MLKIISYHCSVGKDRKIMASLRERYGTWALVAGAAEGLGEGFCTILAANGFSLILVDHNAGAMQHLALRLREEHRIETVELYLDLADPGAAGQCLGAMASGGCRLMVYVAAHSRVCRFNELENSELDRFVSVNTRTLLQTVHGFSKRLIDAGDAGGIILVSSLAGLIGPKYVAAYAATKAFSIRLAEALEGELKVHGIDIMACCAGTVDTPTYWKSKPNFEKMKPLVMQPAGVASYALKNLGSRTTCIPGLINRLQYLFLVNLIPRRVARKLVNQAMDKMYGAV